MNFVLGDWFRGLLPTPLCGLLLLSLLLGGDPLEGAWAGRGREAACIAATETPALGHSSCQPCRDERY